MGIFSRKVKSLDIDGTNQVRMIFKNVLSDRNINPFELKKHIAESSMTIHQSNIIDGFDAILEERLHEFKVKKDAEKEQAEAEFKQVNKPFIELKKIIKNLRTLLFKENVTLDDENQIESLVLVGQNLIYKISQEHQSLSFKDEDTKSAYRQLFELWYSYVVIAANLLKTEKTKFTKNYTFEEKREALARSASLRARR